MAHVGIFIKTDLKATEHSALCNLSVEQCCEIAFIHLIDSNLLVICFYMWNVYSNKKYDLLGVLERALVLAVNTGLDFVTLI